MKSPPTSSTRHPTATAGDIGLATFCRTFRGCTPRRGNWHHCASQPTYLAKCCIKAQTIRTDKALASLHDCCPAPARMTHRNTPDPTRNKPPSPSPTSAPVHATPPGRSESFNHCPISLHPAAAATSGRHGRRKTADITWANQPSGT